MLLLPRLHPVINPTFTAAPPVSSFLSSLFFFGLCLRIVFIVVVILVAGFENVAVVVPSLPEDLRRPVTRGRYQSRATGASLGPGSQRMPVLLLQMAHLGLCSYAAASQG